MSNSKSTFTYRPWKNRYTTTMIDLFRILQKYPGFDFQNPDFSDGGRKKICFPENWDYYFSLYETKQISTNAF